MNKTKILLEEALEKLDAKAYIQSDPIKVVRKMYTEQPNSTLPDVELCAMFTMLVGWGEKSSMIIAANRLMDMCHWEPAEYIKYGEFYDIPDDKQIYRTINGKMFKAACHTLRQFYRQHDSVANCIKTNVQSANFEDLFYALCKWFEPARLGSPERDSACKRLCMLLRWMVREDKIDLGLWKAPLITPADLYAILDTKVCQQAKRLNLISYPRQSWRAVRELTYAYRFWDSKDPLKYDLVLNSYNIIR